MPPARWREIEAIFYRIVELPPDQREPALRDCDPELRAEVESLLSHEGRTAGFVRPAIGAVAKAVAGEAADTMLGQRLGPYRITRVLGQGGMGAVYEAVRDDQYQQRVAIKLVRRDADTESLRQRFLQERQILAALEHPHIARLLDGGAAPGGVPYLVMEYIEGETILEYARSRELTIHQRINLFEKVCGAVAFAHQKLVVHRDLKPSNILVTIDGAPRLLDFGIAKLLDADPRDAATGTAALIMSPDYASPEQVRGEAAVPANDIYSLGAVLFELLTGTRPHALSTYSPAEIVREICDREPRKPSETAPAKLKRKLEGDLDTIVLTAMNKDAARRYATVDALSNDLHRYLEGRPISARPDTFGYRARKFLSRHRLTVAASALFVIAVTAAVASAILQGQRAKRRFDDLRNFAHAVVFELHDAIENVPGSTAARELLVRRSLQYLDGLSRDSGSDPNLKRELAEAYERLGTVQGNPAAANTGDRDLAAVSLEKAAAIYRTLPVSGRGLARVSRQLSLVQLTRGHLSEALDWAHRSLDEENKITATSRAPADQRDLAAAHGALGYILLQRGDLKGALPEAVQETQGLEALSLAQPNDATLKHSLSIAYRRLGQIQARSRMLREGFATMQRSVAIAQSEIAAQPESVMAQTDLATSYEDLARGYTHQGNLEGANDLLRKALALEEQLAAADPANLRSQTSIRIILVLLAQNLTRQHKSSESEPMARRALNISEALHKSHPSARTQADVANSLIVWADAKPAGTAALSAYRRAQNLYLELDSRNALTIDDKQDLAALNRKLNQRE